MKRLKADDPAEAIVYVLFPPLFPVLNQLFIDSFLNGANGWT
jgi:hypothetical protein